MARRAVFVVTEHPSHLTAPRARGYERIRSVLERLAGRPVDAVHYRDAHRLDADTVIFYKEVDGVLTADPRIVPEARVIHRIAYDEISELANTLEHAGSGTS